jgi:hypothetical protein
VNVSGADEDDAANSKSDNDAHHRLINNREIASRRNVIIADVSATPYANITADSRIFRPNHTEWAKDSSPISSRYVALQFRRSLDPYNTWSTFIRLTVHIFRYVGLTEYLRGMMNPFPGSHHIRRDTFFAALEQFSDWVRTQKRMQIERDDLLAVDYAMSLVCCECRKRSIPPTTVYIKLRKLISRTDDKTIYYALTIYRAFIVGLRSKVLKVDEDHMPGKADAWRNRLAPNFKKQLVDAFTQSAELKVDGKRDAEAVGLGWSTSRGTSDTRTFQDWVDAGFKWTETDRIVEEVVVNKNACVIRTSRKGCKPGTRFYTLLQKVRKHFCKSGPFT